MEDTNTASRRKRKRNERRLETSGVQQDQGGRPPLWLDGEGYHAILPGPSPTPQQLAEATKRYQENIRKSPLWNEMVAQFGLLKAEQMLKEFRVELRR